MKILNRLRQPSVMGQGTKLEQSYNLKYIVNLMIFFILGMVISKAGLIAYQSNLEFRAKIDLFELGFCNLSLQLFGSSHCQAREDSYNNLVDNVARLPDLKTALAKLHWRGGDERNATRFSVMVRSIQAGKLETGSSRPWELTRDKLTQVWTEFPEIVSASNCYWCDYHDSNLYEWFEANQEHKDYLERLTQSTPHIFGQFIDRLNLPEQEVRRLAQIQAELANHGNRGGFLSKVLRKHNDKEFFSALIRNTSSAAPLLDVDWSTVPFEDAKISWEAGIRENDDLPRFTEYMLSVGHRPALRWLLWVVSDVDNSFWLQSSKKFRKEYLQLYHNFIEFQLVDGLTASEYYSIHWKDIIWDTARQKWRHK